MNLAYDRLGPVFGTAVNRFFAGSTVSAPFTWNVRFPIGLLEVPVFPELQRSWSNALVWRWPPNLPVRRFYERYVEEKGFSGQPLLLDAGANDGMHSCFFALAGWDCVAFEPQAGCIEYLKRIADLNDFRAIVAERCVVGDHEATDVEFYVSESTWFSSLDRTSVERYEPATPQRIDMITLDGYCQRRGLTPKCIKIDVEGAELGVLRGAQRLLQEARPDLVIEVSAEPETRTGLWNLLAPLGYHCHVLSDGRDRVLRPIGDFDAFVMFGASDAHIDAVFIGDDSLNARLAAIRA